MAASFRCDNHPPMSAKFHCARCNVNICGMCVNKVMDRPTCGKCGDGLKDPPRELQKRATAVSVKTGEPGSKMLSRMRGDVVGNAPSAASIPPAASVPPPPPPSFAPAATAPAVVAPPPVAASTPPVFAAPPPSATAFIAGSGVNPNHVRCGNHREIPAAKNCMRCGKYYCRDCMKKEGLESLCPGCNVPLSGLSPQEQGIPVKPLSEQFPAAFGYPFVGEGKWMLAIGGIFFWVLSFGGWRGSALAAAFLCAYLMKIIRVSATGKDEPPGWPSLGYEELGQPLWHIFVCTLLAIAPAFLFLILLQPGGLSTLASDDSFSGMESDDEEQMPDANAIMGDPSNVDPDAQREQRERMRAFKMHAFKRPSISPVFFILLLGGLLFLPMAILGVTLFRSFDALNPAFMLSAIQRLGSAYWLAAGLTVLAVIVDGVGAKVDQQIPILGRLVATFISLYVVMVKARILGVLYYVKQKELGWFM